ncbi:MAG: rhodanese-like domain-containing protein [Candidatus Aminicenantes bacterium]|nr:rhodanese-like domain-containing protein [Candidatus Aminicenantes bacterium]NIR09236.1 rhodanese-like domain-containing protein [Candidatus Aminicenantes bacterium]
MVKEISPPDAWEILQSDPKATLLDVRTSMEYQYVGHPAGSVNIPWQEAPEWEIDTDFVDKVRGLLSEKSGSDNEMESLPILVICRSGKRSRVAAEELERNGFKLLYNVDEGFEGDRDNKNHRSKINGWRFHNLPWEQS